MIVRALRAALPLSFRRRTVGFLMWVVYFPACFMQEVSGAWRFAKMDTRQELDRMKESWKASDV